MRLLRLAWMTALAAASGPFASAQIAVRPEEWSHRLSTRDIDPTDTLGAGLEARWRLQGVRGLALAPPPSERDAAEPMTFAGARFGLHSYDPRSRSPLRGGLEFQPSECNQVTEEAWEGVELHTSSGWSIQYLACWQGPQVRWGLGSRSSLRSIFQVSKALGP